MSQVRKFRPDDWPAVQVIYQEGIDTKIATFQQRAKEWDEWDASVLKECRLVATVQGGVVGWAGLSAVSPRYVYRGVAEVSIYISRSYWGEGVGRKLLEALIVESEKAGFWTLQAGIFPENTASLALHQKCGFRVVGLRERLGKMDDTWRDVLLLERRSQVVGV
jgi:phosphinothricin acetyltransferase